MPNTYNITDMRYMQRLDDIQRDLFQLISEMYQDPDRYDVILSFLDEASRMIEGASNDLNYRMRNGFE